MPKANSISVLIVDDSEIVRVGLKTTLEINADNFGKRLRVVGEAHSVKTAVAQASLLKPNVVVLDVRLPDGSGLTACRRILAEAPETMILVLTSASDDNLIYEAMNSGAHGYLLKEIDAQGLCQAMVDVSDGKFILDPTLTTHVLNKVRTDNAQRPAEDKFALLSAQERRVLTLVAEGKTNKEVAEEMDLSDKTVKNYLSNVFEKLQIRRRSQAAVMYLEGRGH